MPGNLPDGCTAPSDFDYYGYEPDDELEQGNAIYWPDDDNELEQGNPTCVFCSHVVGEECGAADWNWDGSGRPVCVCCAAVGTDELGKGDTMAVMDDEEEDRDGRAGGLPILRAHHWFGTRRSPSGWLRLGCWWLPHLRRLPCGERRGEIMTRLLEWWCRFSHWPISRPFHGRYICFQCLRSYEVNWK